MKKIFVFVCLVISYSTVITGCSEDKETNTSDATAKRIAVSAENIKGEVPRDRLIYDMFGKAANASTTELVEAYKKDISTADPDYLTNLKNMWLAVINPRVYKDGTEDQKLFFINEQLALDNNLAHFQAFYNLLATSKKLSREEKEKIANAYFDKNRKAIADAEWPDPKTGKNKETQLVYAKRTYLMLLSTQK